MDHLPEPTTPSASPADTPAPSPEPNPHHESDGNGVMPLSEEDRRWNLIAHYGASALLVATLGTCGWLAGLLTLFLKGSSPIVRAHAVESVNFQLTWGLLTAVGIALAVLTSWTCFSVLFGISALTSGVFALIFSLIGGRHASRGELFLYPVSFRIIQ